MTDITLAGITLPGDLVWSDEFQSWKVGQARKTSLTGALILHVGILQGGRPITLETSQEGDNWVGLIRLDTLRALQALEEDPDAEPLSLVLPDHNTGTRTLSVAFRRDDGKAIEARSIRVISPFVDADYFAITLRLIQVD